MLFLKRSVVFIATIITVHLQRVQCQSPFIIADDRVRSLDISPVLGRGYSIMTNTFQSTCLIVEQTTIPSFNYDYFFTEFISSETNDETLGGSIQGSASIQGVLAEVNAEASMTSKETMQKHVITATMKIERYYSSVREEVSPLAEDAFTLLQTQDYVGFFKACGPNYVRSLRRAQEVTAMFTFQSESSESAMSFSAGLKLTAPQGKGSLEAKVNGSNDNTSAKSSLEIKILGFGMGLNQDGSDTMVATTLTEYQGVMKFAFLSMTQNEDAHNIGMVYGMEVIPWVNNLAFQVAAKVAEENVIIPLPRSLIPRAYQRGIDANGIPLTTLGSFTVGNRDEFRCKADNPLWRIDKYGFCCEAPQLYDPVTETYPEPAGTCELNTCVCRPVQNLDKSLVKENMSNNGEFVARLDNAMRYKLASLASVEKCISAINAIPFNEYKDYLLKANDSVKYDAAMENKITLMHLRMAVDPLQNYGMVNHLANELDEWIAMYYSPCLSALYGMNVGTSPSTDVSLFMAYPWHAHDECMKLSCITNQFRWDRINGGCTTSITTGSGTANADAYGNTASTTYCAKDGEKYGDNEVCKISQDSLHNFQIGVQQCWRLSVTPDPPPATPVTPVVSMPGVDYMINYYCNPQLTGERYPDTVAMAEFESKYVASCVFGGYV